MMEHPDLLLKLYEDKHREQLRQVEIWRLARVARQQRANYISQGLDHLIALARQRLHLEARPQPVQPKLVNLPK
jgi:hypothetical protein